MRRIYVTLCGRVEKATDSPKDVGEVAVLDVDSGELVHNINVQGTIDVVSGRTRGAQGIDWHNGEIIVGTRGQLFYYNADDYALDGVADDPDQLIGDTGHQIRSVGDTIIICQTLKDNRIVVRNREVVECEPVPEGRDGVDTLHFNAIAISPSGEEWHVYRERHAVFNYTAGGKVHLQYDGSTHDICFLDDDHVLTCNSHEGELHLLDLISGVDRTVFHRFTGTSIRGYQEGYLRGVAFDASTKTVFVHRSSKENPQLFMLDSETFAEKGMVEYHTGKIESAFDLLLDPRDWELDGKGYDGKSFKKEYQNG